VFSLAIFKTRNGESGNGDWERGLGTWKGNGVLERGIGTGNGNGEWERGMGTEVGTGMAIIKKTSFKKRMGSLHRNNRHRMRDDDESCPHFFTVRALLNAPY
jgi:hypothetical protein